MPPAEVHLGLGSNLGDRAAHIERALAEVAGLPRTRVLASSAVIETDPIGPADQEHYLNAAAVVATCLPPRALLSALHEIERGHGRDRATERRWGPRTLDLDILVYADRVMDEPGLTIPHPRLHERAFVLRPMAELSPELVVPGLCRTIRQLLDDLAKSENGVSA